MTFWPDFKSTNVVLVLWQNTTIWKLKNPLSTVPGHLVIHSHARAVFTWGWIWLRNKRYELPTGGLRPYNTCHLYALLWYFSLFVSVNVEIYISTFVIVYFFMVSISILIISCVMIQIIITNLDTQNLQIHDRVNLGLILYMYICNLSIIHCHILIQGVLQTPRSVEMAKQTKEQKPDKI